MASRKGRAMHRTPETIDEKDITIARQYMLIKALSKESTVRGGRLRAGRTYVKGRIAIIGKEVDAILDGRKPGIHLD